jgi:hypothetical protein
MRTIKKLTDTDRTLIASDPTSLKGSIAVSKLMRAYDAQEKKITELETSLRVQQIAFALVPPPTPEERKVLEATALLSPADLLELSHQTLTRGAVAEAELARRVSEGKP